MIGDHTDTIRLVCMALEFTPFQLITASTIAEGLVISDMIKPDFLILEGGILLGGDANHSHGALQLPIVPWIILRERGKKIIIDSLGLQNFKCIVDKPFTPLMLHHAMESALKSVIR